MIHFVGFRGEEYWSAVKVWGKPDFYHIGLDTRMSKLAADSDTIILANGCEHMGRRTSPDILQSPETHDSTDNAQ